MSATRFHSRASLAADLARLGVAAGDIVMVHAACRKVGPVLGGPDSIIAALLVDAAAMLAFGVDWLQLATGVGFGPHKSLSYRQPNGLRR